MSNSKLKPVIVIGGGGHASILVDILRSQNREILAVVCPEDISTRKVFEQLRHIESDADVLTFPKEHVKLVNGVGMTPRSSVRRSINEYFLSLGYSFETVIDTTAFVSTYAEVEEGAQIFNSAVIQTGAHIGAHSIINSSVLVEHDCRIGTYNHLAPRATLCGQVTTEAEVYIGAGATLIQGIVIGNQAIIGAGSTIIRDVETQQLIYSSLNQIKESV